jgi:hypothetical protein
MEARMLTTDGENSFLCYFIVSLAINLAVVVIDETKCITKQAIADSIILPE